MKIKVLKEDVEHHVKEEEGEMFPDAKRFLGESRLVELGAQYWKHANRSSRTISLPSRHRAINRGPTSRSNQK